MCLNRNVGAVTFRHTVPCVCIISHFLQNFYYCTSALSSSDLMVYDGAWWCMCHLQFSHISGVLTPSVLCYLDPVMCNNVCLLLLLLLLFLTLLKNEGDFYFWAFGYGSVNTSLHLHVIIKHDLSSHLVYVCMTQILRVMRKHCKLCFHIE